MGIRESRVTTTTMQISIEYSAVNMKQANRAWNCDDTHVIWDVDDIDIYRLCWQSLLLLMLFLSNLRSQLPLCRCSSFDQLHGFVAVVSVLGLHLSYLANHHMLNMSWECSIHVCVCLGVQWERIKTRKGKSINRKRRSQFRCIVMQLKTKSCHNTCRLLHRMCLLGNVRKPAPDSAGADVRRQKYECACHRMREKNGFSTWMGRWLSHRSAKEAMFWLRMRLGRPCNSRRLPMSHFAIIFYTIMWHVYEYAFHPSVSINTDAPRSIWVYPPIAGKSQEHFTPHPRRKSMSAKLKLPFKMWSLPFFVICFCVGDMPQKCYMYWLNAIRSNYPKRRRMAATMVRTFPKMPHRTDIVHLGSSTAIPPLYIHITDTYNYTYAHTNPQNWSTPIQFQMHHGEKIQFKSKRCSANVPANVGWRCFIWMNWWWALHSGETVSSSIARNLIVAFTHAWGT